MTEAESVDVAIVGAGPAGLGAALALRRRGVARVVVLEREPEAGGVPRHCGHPPFGMREFGRVLSGPDYARRLVDRVRVAGVEIRPQQSVVAISAGGGVTIAGESGVAELRARRGILATGVRESSRHARLISGDRPLGVITTGTLQAMVHLHHLAPFSQPVVVGTELVALSALLTCRKAHIRPVAMIESAPRPTARMPLLLYPRLLGIPVHYATDLAEIVGRSRVESVAVMGPTGPATIACDGVLLTGSFVPEAALVRGSHLELDPGSGGPTVDQFGRCSDPAWFAAGNLLRAVETAGWSFAEGQRIGSTVADDLAGLLPSSNDSVPVARGAGLKLVIPHRLAIPVAACPLDRFQLRVSAPIEGELQVIVDGKPLWRRTVKLRPERRVLVPLRALTLQPAIRSVEIKMLQLS